MTMTMREFVEKYAPDAKTLRRLCDYDEPVELDSDYEPFDANDTEYTICDLTLYARGEFGESLEDMRVCVWAECDMSAYGITTEGDDYAEAYEKARREYVGGY